MATPTTSHADEHAGEGWRRPSLWTIAAVAAGCIATIAGLVWFSRLPPPSLPAGTDLTRHITIPRRVDAATRQKLQNVVPSIPSTPRSFEDVTAQIAPSLVLLETDAAQGTGTIVHPEGYILTNAHVVADALYERGRLWDGSSVPLAIRAIDRAADVVLLDGPLGYAPHVTLGDSDTVRAGEEIGVGGYPLGTAMEDDLGIAGGSPSFTKGVIGAVRFQRGHVVFQFDAPVTGGYSGGPVFRANTGEVIGLITGQIVDRHGTTGLCFAVGINSAKALWEDQGTGP